jgi:hypothetical protein
MDTFNPPGNPSAMVAGLKPYKNQSKKQKKKNPRKRKNQSDDSDSESDSSKTKDKPMQCYYCCKRGHKLLECRLRERAKKIRQGGNRNPEKKATANIADAVILASYTAFTAPTSRSSSFSSAWHIDSAASDHVCNNIKAFQELYRLTTPVRIRVGDNGTTLVTRAGSVLLTTFAKDKQQR